MSAEQVRFEQAGQYDPIVLAEIYDEYSVKIYNYIYHKTGDRALAEDLMADVFLRALEAIQDDKGWTSSLQGWLYRIAHNLVVDHYRRQSKREGPPLNERIAATDDRSVQIAERILSGGKVRSALEHLTEEQQQVIVLKFAEDLSNREVAEILGKTEGAVKALQHRGLAALRRVLNVEEERQL
jgi:RNA polymerase sigma-70 factor (ECF subfamily)